MDESEAKNRKEPESQNPDSDNDDQVEVEIRASESEDGTPADESEPKETVEEPDGTEPPTAVAEPPSLEDQLREKEDQYLRLAAEFDNYRKRTARQLGAMIESAQVEVISELLKIQDNFERALQVNDDSGKFADFRKGVELIFSQLTDLLRKNGVEPFESVGEKFDPNYHEAVMTVESDDHEEGVVVEEFTKGYRLKERVLRHAKVSVAQAKE
jgi:molecular chaperone GrpE